LLDGLREAGLVDVGSGRLTATARGRAVLNSVLEVILFQ
jgi:hypothetical protein